MKGIILAGGTGCRLYPATLAVSKQLIPIYDKPMIYYPLSVLMLAEIRDILLISTPKDLPIYRQLLGDGSRFGVRLSFVEQTRPEGLAQAFLIGKDFIGKENVCLILGDNIFYGNGLKGFLSKASNLKEGAEIFAFPIRSPQNFGIIEVDVNNKAISIEEKPKNPKSNLAVAGLYFYDNEVVKIAKNLNPSARGELEITDINRCYLENKRLVVNIVGRGIAWLDTGTHDDLIKASIFVEAVENRQGLKIACLEEIGFKNGWITKDDLILSGRKMQDTDYGRYILSL
ncbi:MAG: glucose-1-phosphate thymidylyltransferase RfbA [Endomicrobium sp.]|jgi:glucose-1-phosphate thymidylyltransferase|nr:glucose-1-phosphate thymidylyltransferase RfbA [Endomicrobium sp.]